MPDVLRFVDSISDYFATITDTFTRTVANGWGSTDSGQAWSTAGGSASDYSVSSGKGRLSLASVGTGRDVTLSGVAVRNCEVKVTTTVSATAVTSPINVRIYARKVDTNNLYRIRLEFKTTGFVTARIQRIVAGSSADIAVATDVVSYSAGGDVHVRFRVADHMLLGKVWTGGTEPIAWSVWVADAEAALQVAGAPALSGDLSAGNTNTLPVEVTFDNFTVTAINTVRLDLNDDVTWGANVEALDFSPPNLRYAIAESMMTDGVAVPSAAYGNRLLKLTLDLKASTVDLAAAEIQKLAREVNRASNFLEWKPGTSQPVFFRTIRSPAGRIIEYPGPGTFKVIEVEILAEPFAYGMRESIPKVTIGNDPATGGQFFDLSNIKGDVDTPLSLLFGQQGPASGEKSCIATATRVGGDLARVPFLLQAESMTLGTDTTLPGNDGGMSGSGSNYARVSFATVATMLERLTFFPFPATANAAAEARGTYRVFCRMRAPGTAHTFQVQLQWDVSSIVNQNDIVTQTDTTVTQMLDLGLVTIPIGQDPVYDGASGRKLDVDGIRVRVRAARTTGSGSLDIDYLVFIPADERMLLAAWGGSFPVVDSFNQYVFLSGGGGGVASNSPSTVQGGFPVAVPAPAINRIYNIKRIQHTSGDTLAETTEITPYYWPRYLYIRPATT